MKKISAIVPVYNGSMDARRAVDSILAQTYPVLEVIVINDGSTEDEAVELSRLMVGDSKIHLYNIANRGAAGARDYGVRVASGDFVAFLDADDVWMPEKLERQMRIFNQDEGFVGLVGCLTNMANFKLPFGFGGEGVLRVGFNMQLMKNFFQTSTVVMPRSVYINCGGFPAGARYAEEGDLFNKIVSKYPCYLLREVLVDYSAGKPGFGFSGLSGNLNEMFLGELRNLIYAFRRRDIGFIRLMFYFNFYLVKFLRRLRLISEEL